MIKQVAKRRLEFVDRSGSGLGECRRPLLLPALQLRLGPGHRAAAFRIRCRAQSGIVWDSKLEYVLGGLDFGKEMLIARVYEGERWSILRRILDFTGRGQDG